MVTTPLAQVYPMMVIVPLLVVNVKQMLEGPNTFNANACVAVADNASVTLTVKWNVPLVVGVPEMEPLAESVSPGGNAPEMFVHLYGVWPPMAARVWW